MPQLHLRRCCAAVTALAALVCLPGISCAPARAQDAAPFFAGKTLRMVIGASVGSGYDVYGRLLARHIGRHIPGKPDIVAQNVQGAAGVVHANHMYNVAPRDGLALGAFNQNSLTEPLVGNKAAKYDAQKFIFIGSMNSETAVCLLRHDAEAKTFADVFTTETVLGSASRGGSTGSFATTYNNVLGTKFRIVAGYHGSPDISLAVKRKEVEGMCGQFWSTLEVQNPEWIDGKGEVRVFAQEGLRGRDDLNRQGVPLVYDFAKTTEQKQILQLLYGPLLYGRPFALPPGVPADRVATIRAAFDAALEDQGLLSEATKSRLDIIPLSAAEMAKVIADLYSIPPAIVTKAEAARMTEK